MVRSYGSKMGFNSLMDSKFANVNAELESHDRRSQQSDQIEKAQDGKQDAERLGNMIHKDSVWMFFYQRFQYDDNSKYRKR